MTEIERILSKGQFTEEFLRSEVICDFLVDIERKEQWLVSLDMLAEVDKVCKRHGLKYYLFFGSLLGAIRHDGFIPWDDDIDIAMPRWDYEELAKFAHEFQAPYFYQSPYTDNGYYFSCNKIRNSNTTAIPRIFIYEEFNQGKGIDIFPLDSYCMDGIEEKFERVKELVVDLGTAMRLNNPELDETNRKRVENYSGRNPMETFEMLQTICHADDAKDSDMMGLVSGNIYGPYRQTFKKEDLEDTMEYDLYGLKVPIPKNYNSILTTIYGDYMQFPPVEKRGTWHSGVIRNMNRPFTEYIKHK